MEFSILILTDHSTHSSENSVYGLASELCQHPDIGIVDIASRGQEENTFFFAGNADAVFSVIPAMPDLTFAQAKELFGNSATEAELSDYDFILLRLPPPAPEPLFQALTERIPADHLINAPEGILHTGSKAFLEEVSELCPRLRVVRTPQEVAEFMGDQPIVLKPMRGYGGNGIVKITSDTAEDAQRRQTPLADYFRSWRPPYLAMEFLERVAEGDKRTIVVAGEVMGSAVRKPATGSWVCNVAQGGTSDHAVADADELMIAERLNTLLAKYGVIIYGFDTLVDNSGRRKLSEINTMSIGGLMQTRTPGNAPIMPLVVNRLVEHLHAVWNGNAA